MRSSPSRVPTRAAAYSLAELVLVLLILAGLAMLGIPRFAGYLTQRRVDSAAQRVAADLGLARRLAQTSSSSRTVQFMARGYELVGVKSLDQPTDAYRVVLESEPYRVSVAAADFGGDTSVTFNGFGTPDSGGSVVISAGGFQRTVTLQSETGAVSVR